MDYNQIERDVISAFYTNKEFVKIKQCLDIGKVLFSFVEMANPKDHIDVYMEAEEFGAILMQMVKTGMLKKMMAEEKAKTQEGQYAKPVYTSPIGGSSKDPNYGTISRYFTIAPGFRSEAVLQALKYRATKNDKGAFIANKGEKPVRRITVPCSYKDLQILYYKWSFLEADYMSNKYKLENMRSAYTRQQADVEEIEQTYEAQDTTEDVQQEERAQEPVKDQIEVKVSDEQNVLLNCKVTSGAKFYQKQNMYAVSINDLGINQIGTLYVRAENYSDALQEGKTFTVIATKKGNNYLYLESA